MNAKLYKKLKEKQDQVIQYIKKHQNATTKEIKIRTGIKVEKAFTHGIKEAYNIAAIDLPKHLLKRDKKYLKKLVINYIKQNRNCTISDIHSKLNVNVWRLFGSIEMAFKAAKVPYTKKEKYNELRNKVINHVKENPNITSTEIYKKTGINIYSIFRNMADIYRLANVKSISFRIKRKLKKQIEIISYINKNPEATQWKINKICKTHVQNIFDGGIREAFDKSGIEYPDSRRILYGTAKISIKRRSLLFQKRVTNYLKKFGNIDAQVRIKHGIVDAVLNNENNIIPIEIKDYRYKPICETEIKQMKKYMTDLNCNFGIIISSKGDMKRINFNSDKIIEVVPIRYIEEYMGLATTRDKSVKL